MYNYYTNSIWAIDASLLSASLALGAAIILNAVTQEYLWRRRTRALLNIKKHVYEMVLADKSARDGKFARFTAVTTPQQFLDITTNRNRELVFFNDAEREIFKKSFISPQSIARLKRLAEKRANKWQRIEAIMSLGSAGAADAVDILTKTLANKDEDISYFSMIALGQLKNTQSAGILLDLLKKKPQARYKLASILENFPPEIAGEAVKLSYDADPSVRVWSVRLVSKFDIAPHIERLKELIRDEAPEVRGAVCECLGKSGIRSAADILIKAFKDDSWLVRVSAVKGLSELVGSSSVPHAASLIRDGSLSVINSVKDVMKAHIEEALPYIEKYLEGSDAMAKKVSIEALEESGYTVRLFKAMISADEGESKRAADLLGGMIKAGAYLGLEGVIKGFDEKPRSKILARLKQIDEAFAEEMSERIKKDGQGG